MVENFQYSQRDMNLFPSSRRILVPRKGLPLRTNLFSTYDVQLLSLETFRVG